MKDLGRLRFVFAKAGGPGETNITSRPTSGSEELAADRVVRLGFQGSSATGVATTVSCLFGGDFCPSSPQGTLLYTGCPQVVENLGRGRFMARLMPAES